jgi:hypothetical protein
MRGTVRDHLWMWGHLAGSHTRSSEQWGLPGLSTITPAGAAAYLGIPNLLMVRYELEPRPPFEEHARSLLGLERVVWSVEGGGGGDVDVVLELRQVMPSLTGVILDDYFTRVLAGGPDTEGDGPFSLASMQRFRRRLDTGERPLDAWVVLYTHELDRESLLRAHLPLCDVVTLWTWKAAELAQLDDNFARFEELVGRKRKVLGLYLWDYGAKSPMPLAAMQRQCSRGLQWLQEKRVEGLIFLPSCVCDLKLEAVEWVKQWIASHGPGGVRDGK